MLSYGTCGTRDKENPRVSNAWSILENFTWFYGPIGPVERKARVRVIQTCDPSKKILRRPSNKISRGSTVPADAMEKKNRVRIIETRGPPNSLTGVVLFYLHGERDTHREEREPGIYQNHSGAP